MRREKKLATAMVSLFFDDERKKLYDKYHSLELSHNRKKKALMKLSRIFAEFSLHCWKVEFETDGVAWNEIRKIISDALFSDGRVNWKTKGGKNV